MLTNQNSYLDMRLDYKDDEARAALKAMHELNIEHFVESYPFNEHILVSYPENSSEAVVVGFNHMDEEELSIAAKKIGPCDPGLFLMCATMNMMVVPVEEKDKFPSTDQNLQEMLDNPDKEISSQVKEIIATYLIKPEGTIIMLSPYRLSDKEFSFHPIVMIADARDSAVIHLGDSTPSYARLLELCNG